MDAERVRMVIIFFAVILLFVFFGLLMYKKGLFRRKMRVGISKAFVRAADTGVFDCQVDLDIETRGEDVCFVAMAISHAVWQAYQGSEAGTYPIRSLVRHPGYCVLDEKKEIFSEKIKILSEHSIDTAGMRLSAGKYRCVSMVDRMALSRPVDDSLSAWPTEGWKLLVRTSAGTVEVPFSFMVHETSHVPAFCRDYVMPPASFACGA